jgi:hypothetical protein
MPTFTTTPRFRRDYSGLTQVQQERFRKIVITEFVPDADAGQFRPGLRVKGVRGTPGVFEMTWAQNGRATWQYGQPRRPGSPHIIWRRVGTHAVLDPGPP